MCQLRPHISQNEYLFQVKQLVAEVGYRLAALTREKQVVCVAGFRFCRSLGWGKYLYVDDLVTDADFRSTGAGEAMFGWLAKLAENAGCGELRLDSAVERHGAHRFYLRERMNIACFNFRLKLKHVNVRQ
jgi:GNAT superfamily N-acetyltransferase